MIIFMVEPHKIRKSIRCTAIKKDGEQCRSWAVSGRRFCKKHQGGVPRGINHPHFKSGIYSKVLPVNFAAIYEQARQDQDLNSLVDESALLKGRTHDLLGTLDQGGSQELWKRLDKAYKKFTAALELQDGPALQAAVVDMGNLITTGLSDSYTWKEILTTIEQRRKVAESERRLNLDRGRMISANRAMIWVGAIMDSLMRNADEILEQQDKVKLISAVSEDLDKLLKASSGDSTEPDDSQIDPRLINLSTRDIQDNF